MVHRVSIEKLTAYLQLTRAILFKSPQHTQKYQFSKVSIHVVQPLSTRCVPEKALFTNPFS